MRKLSEQEKEVISIRTKEALQKMKDNGFSLGRPSKQYGNGLPSIDEIAKLWQSGASLNGIAKTLHCSRYYVKKAVSNQDLRKTDLFLSELRN